MPHTRTPPRKILRIAALALMLCAIALTPILSPRAQRSQGPDVNVAGVTAKQSGDSTVVTVSGDVPLTRTQTWQDSEGFHLILPRAGRSQVRGVPRGVKVRQVGESLEVLIGVKQGGSVTVQPDFNHLNLVVNGGIETQSHDAFEDAESQTPRRKFERSEADSTGVQPTLPRYSRERATRMGETLIASASKTEKSQPAPFPAASPLTANDVANVASNNASSALPAANQQAANPQQANATQAVAPPQVAAESNNAAPVNNAAGQAGNNGNPAPQSQMNVAGQSDNAGVWTYLFSVTGVAVILTLALVGFLLWRRLGQSSKADTSDEKNEEKQKDAENVTNALAKRETAETLEPVQKERRKAARRSSDQSARQQKALSSSTSESESREQSLEVRQPAALSAPLFGAYRVDQEIGKLVLGQPHRLDVLLSRAPEDRQAMELSLLKTLNAPEADDDCCRRARRALEEYGFVARRSASLLLAREAYERASAARTLGEIGSPLALPFLLEALYDMDLVVRTQAVSSLGELKMPSAIGALLDMARRYPEMPLDLIKRTLSSCSFESINGFGMLVMDSEHASESGHEQFTGEITHFEHVKTVEQLPEWLEDETLSEALARLEDTDVEARTAAVRQLAQFQVQRAVEALTAIAFRDEDSGVRAAAVSSLGTIGHESVFAPVLIALGDSSRGVQAAAARALSRLSFDRADAYVRVLETADAETLRAVAQSCINAGIAKQAIDRLASEDRRHAYEAFSLLSLLAKSNETGPILEAIASHDDMNVRLAAVRLLGLEGRPEVATQLRHLVVRDGLPEKIRTALLEVVYKIDQGQPV